MVKSAGPTPDHPESDRGPESDRVPELNIQPSDEKRSRAKFWPKLRKNMARIPFAQDVCAVWFCATDDETPVSVKATLWAALAYFVLPIDAVADFLPIVGFTDDAAVLALVLSRLGSAIRPAHRDKAAAILTQGVGVAAPYAGSEADPAEPQSSPLRQA